MRLEKTEIEGVVLFMPEPSRDERGFFTRTFDAAVASEAGLDPAALVQDSQSRSHRGVLRGLHLRGGAGEGKLVRCAHGAIFDVVVDLRRGSATFGTWQGFRLDDADHHVLYVPRGCAHGWQALTEPADVCYRIDAEHDPAEDLTVAWDDPDLGISWPLTPTAISARDRAAPRLAAVLERLAP